jgi:molecular chaperone DnaJ
MLRLRGKGVADLRGGPAGDLVARIVFEVPQRLTGKQRGLLEDLAKSLDASNFPEVQTFADRLKTFYAHKDKLSR